MMLQTYIVLQMYLYSGTPQIEKKLSDIAARVNACFFAERGNLKDQKNKKTSFVGTLTKEKKTIVRRTVFTNWEKTFSFQ